MTPISRIENWFKNYARGLMSLRVSGGTLKGRRLIAPRSGKTRPTSEKLRQAFFNIYQHLIPDAHFLDLFAGTGAMGIEAISRGAASATFIEKERSALISLQKNIGECGIEAQCTVIRGDVLKALPHLTHRFDIIYIDPPYGKGFGDSVIYMLDRGDYMSENGVVVLEETSYTEKPLAHLILKEKRPFGERFLYRFAPDDNSVARMC